MIWKLKYALILWRAGIDWKTSWYSAGEAYREPMRGDAREAAIEELSYWAEG